MDAVVHLAAMAGVQPSFNNSDRYTLVNVKGTFMVLEACRKHRITNVIVASSSSVYGDCTTFPFIESQSHLNPLSPYAESKRNAELIARKFARDYGMQIKCLRLFTVYGPRQRPDMAISLFAKGILKGEPIKIYGNGDSSRDYTYVQDIVRGIIDCLNLNGSHVLNLGSSKHTKLIDLIELIAQIIGKPVQIEFLSAREGDPTRTCANIHLAARLIEYEPKTSLETGIRLFIDWLKLEPRGLIA